MADNKVKSIVLPIAIVVVGGLIGGTILLNSRLDKLSTGTDVIGNNQNLRLLSFKAPGMFCIGCSASVEGYLKAIDGVQSVNASLATKQVDVIYDPSIVGKDVILDNEILAAYGKQSVSDVSYTGGSQAKTPSTTNLPQALALKLQDAAGIVSQLSNPVDYQGQFDKIDQAIVQQDYQQAEDLLDELLAQLQE